MIFCKETRIKPPQSVKSVIPSGGFRMKVQDAGKSMTLTATLCCALGAISAHSALIDVNFYSAGYGGSTASGAAVVGGASDIWNGIAGDNGSGSGISLVDANGNTTSVTLSYDTSGGSAITSVAQNTQPNPSLMNDYLFNNTGGDITVTLQGLVASTPYDLYVYLASNDGGSGARAAEVTANSVFASATGDPQASFIPGQNYILLAATSDASGTINITESDSAGVNFSGEVDMNGLQISSVPEPTTLSLLAISGLGLILFARRSARRVHGAA